MVLVVVVVGELREISRVWTDEGKGVVITSLSSVPCHWSRGLGWKAGRGCEGGRAVGRVSG